MRVRGASVDITPESPQLLGASSVAEPIHQVRDPLEANVIHLADGDRQLVVISLDLLYPGRVLRHAVEDRLRGILGPDQIFTAASHTHAAPAVDVDKPLLGVVDLEYLDWVCQRIVETVKSMLEQPAPDVPPSVWSAFARSSINRRLPRAVRLRRSGLVVDSVGLGPNPHGPRNESVTVVALGDPSAPEAVIWSYACHPTSAPLPVRISAHYPGAVRDAMRVHFANDDLPVVFLQGFSGDVRPPSVLDPSGAKSKVRRWTQGRQFGAFDEPSYEHWLTDLESLVLGSMAGPGKKLRDELRVARVEFPQREFVSGGRPQATASFHGFSLGTLNFVGVSAEVVTEYTQRLQSFFPGEHAVGVGCIDDTLGYVPLESMLGTRGYEDSGFCPLFGLTSVASGVESSMMKGFAAVAQGLRDCESGGGT